MSTWRLVRIAIPFALATLFWTWAALAERVVLVRPTEETPHLTEIFLRLQGELRMQGFEAVYATAETKPNFAEMKRIATLAHADSCVSFELTKGSPTVHLWVFDPLTNAPQTFSFTGSSDADSASELPLRTVELLRSSLMERRDASNATAETLAPRTPLPLVTGTVRPVPIKPLSWDRRRVSARWVLGPTWGALTNQAFVETALSMGFRLLPNFEVALLFTLPLTTTKLRGSDATASYAFYQFGPELRILHPVGFRRFYLEYDTAIVATYFRANAAATEPWVTMNAAGWTATARVGVGAWYSMQPYLALGVLTNLGLSAPHPVVEVGTRSQSLGRPSAAVGLGLTARF